MVAAMRLLPRRPKPLIPGQPIGVYVRRYGPGEFSTEWMETLNGVDWWEADPPPRLHHCWPQSRMWSRRELVERCACGALRFDGTRPWIDRNTNPGMTEEDRAAHERVKHTDALIGEYERLEAQLPRARTDPDPPAGVVARMAEIRDEVKASLGR